MATLEKSELIYRKESGNKWKYYALTAKGESVVKPERMWAIAFSSLVGIIAGGFLLSSVYPRYAANAPTVSSSITEKAGEAATLNSGYDVTGTAGIVLITLGAVGLLYFVWKKLRH